MNRWKVLFYIFVVCCILSIAIFSPNMVSSYLQKSLDGKVSYVDVGIKTYEVKYYSIWEKIVSIKKCVDEEGKLNTIHIATEVNEQLKDTLTQQVVEQITMLKEGIICDFFDIRTENLISCKKYAIYSSNNANGINLWYLKYQNKEDTIQLVMDTEFNHIYRLQLSLSKGGAKLWEQYLTQMGVEGVTSVMYSICDSWTDNLSNYYNIDRGQVLYTFPDTSLLYKKQLLYLYGDLYYETATKAESANTSSYNINYYDKGGSVVDASNVSIFCEYQWKTEGGITLNWGFTFFNTMMQL